MEHQRNRLASPDGLLVALQSLFPEFGNAELTEEVRSGHASQHTVMMEFASYFNAASAEPRQLAGLASLMSQCIEETDALENAVGTCFLEHLRQIDGANVLWKCLASDVKDYVRRS